MQIAARTGLQTRSPIERTSARVTLSRHTSPSPTRARVREARRLLIDEAGSGQSRSPNERNWPRVTPLGHDPALNFPSQKSLDRKKPLVVPTGIESDIVDQPETTKTGISKEDAAFEVVAGSERYVGQMWAANSSATRSRTASRLGAEKARIAASARAGPRSLWSSVRFVRSRRLLQ